jgi:quinol monooxygenase YgiN
MIYVIATVELKPGCRAAYLEVLLGNVTAVKAEKGCLVYAPTIDVKTDIPIHEEYDDNVVTIIESWEDIAALKNHFNEPHMLAYLEKVKDLIKKVSIRVLKPV